MNFFQIGNSLLLYPRLLIRIVFPADEYLADSNSQGCSLTRIPKVVHTAADGSKETIGQTSATVRQIAACGCEERWYTLEHDNGQPVIGTDCTVSAARDMFHPFRP